MRILIVALVSFLAFGCMEDDGTQRYNVLDGEAETHLETSYVYLINAAEFMDNDLFDEADSQLDLVISEEKLAKQKLGEACKLAEKNPKLECHRNLIDEIELCLIPQAQFLKKQMALFESMDGGCDAACIQQKCDDYLNDALLTDAKCSQSPLPFDPDVDGMYPAAVEVCNDYLLSP